MYDIVQYTTLCGYKEKKKATKERQFMNDDKTIKVYNIAK
jgi:hypothetical protein